MDHSAQTHNVPPALIAQRQAGWHHFMRFTTAHVVAIIGLLLFLLLVFKVF